MAASAKKAPAGVPAARASSARGSAGKKAVPAGKSVRKPAAKKSAPASEPGKGLEGWSTAEKSAIRAALESNIAQLRSEIAALRQEIDELTADAASATGDDQADTGSRNFERDHELQVVQNANVLLEQNERALARLGEGTYGLCESCGQPIAKGRLQAYPSATLCVTCKSAQERR